MSSLPSMRFLAELQLAAGLTMTSSPGRQSAGRATPKASAVCKAISVRYSSSKLRPTLRG